MSPRSSRTSSGHGSRSTTASNGTSAREPRDGPLQDAHTAEVERVVDLRPFTARLHEAGFAENLQMLADCRLADREDLGKVARTRPALRGKTESDPKPHRMTEGLELRRRIHLHNYITVL
jgi:hypothetical protein